MSHPWSAPAHDLPTKPAGPEYGWVDADGWHAATRETLEARCRKAPPPQAVWTPDDPRLQLPAEVPWLREALAEGARTPPAGRAPWLFAAAGAALLALWWLRRLPDASFWLGLGGVAIGVMLWITAASRARQAARAITPEHAAATREEVAYARWLRGQRVTYTTWIGYALIAVAVCQLLVGQDLSLDRAELDPWDVRDGEWWRLATGPMLHGNPLHFFLNYGALLALGRMLEVHTHRAYVSLSFVVAAVVGGVASLVIPPETRSVGASGGILGLLGTLLALGLLRKRHLPPHFTRGLWASVGATALLGLVAWTYIDNAAHLGGLLAGAALGLLFLPHRDAPSVVPGRLVVLLGDASLGLVFAAAALAIWKMLQGP